MNSAFYFCISGFTQSQGRFHGILKLREHLHLIGCNHGPESRISYVTWKHDFHRMAADLSIVCNRHGFAPMVMIAGYSYGGWGSLKFAAELERVGIEVESMVLSDPVGRPWYWPRPLPAATSMLGRTAAPALRVPSNVKRLSSYFQTLNRPQGHRLISDDSCDEQPPIHLQNRRHESMDDAPEFHGCAMKEAERIQRILKGETL